MEDTKRERIRLEVTRSLRPKEYTRKTLIGSLHQHDSERFYHNALSTLKNGTFSDIHLKCQLEDYERHHYATEKKVLEKEAELEKQYLLERSVLRQTMLTKHKAVMAENTRKIEEMTEKWKKTQKVKKDRQIRDLQFELTMSRVEELKDLQQKQIHERQEKEGITQFERNMKKLGIAAGDSNEGGMSISYETKEAYEERIKELANQTMPTSEEVNNFKEQLKDRTAANRLARYEKARRRRRALVQGDKGNDGTAGTINDT